MSITPTARHLNYHSRLLESPSKPSLLLFVSFVDVSRFYSLAWGYVTPEKPHGVIAGAMDDGHLNIWDVNSIFQNPASSLITSNQTRGTVKVVEFNPVTPKLLISAGTGGEVMTYD